MDHNTVIYLEGEYFTYIVSQEGRKMGVAAEI